MPAEQKPVIRKIGDASKDFVKTTVDRSQEVAIASVVYSPEIWWVGPGAFSQAREEGSRAFDKVSNPNDTLEDIFDNRVARAIKRTGIPAAKTLKSLSE